MIENTYLVIIFIFRLFFLSSRDHSLRETSSRGSDLAPGLEVHQHGFERLENLDSEQHESEPDLVERNLALLTAQYEKSQVRQRDN